VQEKLRLKYPARATSAASSLEPHSAEIGDKRSEKGDRIANNEGSIGHSGRRMPKVEAAGAPRRVQEGEGVDAPLQSRYGLTMVFSDVYDRCCDAITYFYAVARENLHT
jgi:hypothetical protein